jgi:hypothetical protein
MSIPFIAYVGGYVVPLEERYLEAEFPDEARWWPVVYVRCNWDITGFFAGDSWM